MFYINVFLFLGFTTFGTFIESRLVGSLFECPNVLTTNHLRALCSKDMGRAEKLPKTIQIIKSGNK